MNILKAYFGHEAERQFGATIPGVAYGIAMHPCHKLWPNRPVTEEWLGHCLLTYCPPGKKYPMVTGNVPLVLDNLYVRPECRRQGYATEMVLGCIQYAEKKGFEIVLRMRPYERGRKMDIDQLREFYRTLGFLPIFGFDEFMYWRKKE